MIGFIISDMREETFDSNNRMGMYLNEWIEWYKNQPITLRHHTRVNLVRLRQLKNYS